MMSFKFPLPLLVFLFAVEPQRAEKYVVFYNSTLL